MTRIAHFNTYDDEGLYFMTMKVKPFYKQLKKNNKVAACVLIAEQEKATHDEQGLPGFPPGYFIRITGDIRELTIEELENKAKDEPRFKPLIKDMERYPTMTVFVLYRYKGEVYDYDFEMVTRNHKLIRERFGIGGMEVEQAGFNINKDQCIVCGQCEKVCSFKAIIPGEDYYSIDPVRCDECGSCYVVCPVGAITAKVPLEEERKEIGRKVKANSNQT